MSNNSSVLPSTELGLSSASTTGSSSLMGEINSALTPEKLDGSNYTEWSINAQNKLRRRKRWGYISGVNAAPADRNSAAYEAWEDENCLVKSWLLDSMTNETRSLFLRLTTAKDIWEVVKETYSVSEDASRGYKLHCEIIGLRQNGSSVIVYFGKLQRLWQESDAIQMCQMQCAVDIEIHHKMVNAQRVYMFLVGLDAGLDGVKG